MLLHLCTRRLAQRASTRVTKQTGDLSPGLRGPVAPPISQSVAEKKAWVVFRRRPAETRPWAAA